VIQTQFISYLFVFKNEAGVVICCESFGPMSCGCVSWQYTL